MASDVNDITIQYEEEGIVLVKELDKSIVSKGAWTTILFKYQEWKRNDEAYGPERYSLRRYRKVSGEYKQQGKFNISSKDQAKKIVETLQKWIDEAEG